MRGWGKNGKKAPDPSVIDGGMKGAAARARSRRKDKVPLTLPTAWGSEPSPYPPGWPHCPVCDDYALDGHITCGRVECDEGALRKAPRRTPGAKWGHRT